MRILLAINEMIISFRPITAHIEKVTMFWFLKDANIKIQFNGQIVSISKKMISLIFLILTVDFNENFYKTSRRVGLLNWMSN